MSRAVRPPSADKGEPVKVFKVGRNPKTLVEVSIYRTSKGRFMASFYDASGKRIRPERASMSDAEQAARDYITKHISPEALERDLLDSKAAKIVAPADLIMACNEYSDAQKLLAPFQAKLLDAVRFYVAKKRETLKSVTAAFAVDDFLSKFKGRQKNRESQQGLPGTEVWPVSVMRIPSAPSNWLLYLKHDFQPLDFDADQADVIQEMILPGQSSGLGQEGIEKGFSALAGAILDQGEKLRIVRRQILAFAEIAEAVGVK
jgi:hypothetical protein